MIRLIASVPPPDPATQAILARQGIALLVALSLATLLLICCVLLLAALRRARTRRTKLARALRDQRAAPVPDAWAEAARRLAVPTADDGAASSADDDLEDTREVPALRDTPEPRPSEEPASRRGAGGRPVVMITGGVRRVGLAIAETFADAGCDLVLTFRTSGDAANAAAESLRARGAQVRLEPLDLSDIAAVEALGQRLAATAPRLDVLIHNASVYDPSPLAGLTADAALMQYRVNALAPLLLTRRLAPLLQRSTLAAGGAVVAMGDIHAMGRPRRDFSAYSMSKAALMEMVRCLSRDLAPRVRVNAVAPGVVAFPDTGRESDPEFRQKYLSRVPLGRSGTPEDAAAVVRWLALDAAYITGEIIRVDGGRWLA